MSIATVMIGSLTAAASGIRQGMVWMDQAASEIAGAPFTVAGGDGGVGRSVDVTTQKQAVEAREAQTAVSKAHERNDPPNFIFAPGHYQADHRTYLVPYPGLAIGDGIIGMVLARRYVQANKAAFHTAAETYRAVTAIASSAASH